MSNSLNVNKFGIVTAFILLIFIPNEVYWSISGVRLEPYRIFLLFVFIIYLPKIIGFKYTKSEFFLLLYCVWVAISFMRNHGFGSGLQSGVIHFLEVFVAFFLGMRIMGNVRSLKYNIGVFCVFFLILMPFAFVEATNGYRLFHALAASITNVDYMPYLGEKYIRFGIHRSSTVFSHPILYSITALMFLALVFNLYKTRVAVVFSVGLVSTIFTSVTSAAFLMFLINVFMFFLYRVSLKKEWIFKFSLIALILVLLFVEFMSNRGAVKFIIDLTSFNSDTAYTRYIQWVHVMQNIDRSPIFGVGFSDWIRPFWMPPSVDSYWLLMTLRHGYVGVLLVSIFFALTLRNYWLTYRATKDKIYYVFFVSIVSLVFAAFTVDLFDRAKPIVYFILGMYNSFLVLERVKIKKEKHEAKYIDAH
ncbi:hypothetical protein ADINL_2368 [Nitrincola lacisaponensis]|uniref:O-antigen polymerase n=1 Tax=Nitrincola lacisaponensis TaxID=267850 RepID=A0A063Y0L1_9GAMM|nr:hypothetical protein [Nitrincola lacisaponensis]KDE39239.1 hypothetical protein ADINL_2368 [Nitrincola lacisaponensis]